jgi:hypothetical protein
MIPKYKNAPNAIAILPPFNNSDNVHVAAVYISYAHSRPYAIGGAYNLVKLVFRVHIQLEDNSK